MKSITIHGMEPDLASRLEQTARESGLSLNKTIKNLLAAALGLPASRQADRRRHFEDLCGAWSKSDAKAFRQSLADFDRVDDEDWK